MNEWIIILVVLVSAGLFAAGGTHIEGIGGQKWLRRYLLPVFLGVIAGFHAPIWATFGYGLTISAFLHLGYGSKAKWSYRAFIFTGYGLSSLWLGWSWWGIIVGPVCYLLFLLSNWRLTAGSFVWKLIELGMGFLVGAGYIGSILNQWR